MFRRSPESLFRNGPALKIMASAADMNIEEEIRRI
jgi:hypothetical protein